jgi:hypothetical protein
VEVNEMLALLYAKTRSTELRNEAEQARQRRDARAVRRGR